MADETTSKSALPVPSRRTREIDAYTTPVAHPNHQRSIGVVIWHRKLLALICMAVALASGALYLSRATPVYSSSSSLFVQQSLPKIVSEDLSVGQLAAISLTTQCELITSTAILGQAARQPIMAGSPVMRGQKDPVGFLKGVVVAEPSKAGDLIVISVTSPFPFDNAIIVNGVVQAYVDYQTRQHQSSAVQVASILQKEVDSHNADLKDEQAKMRDLRLENPQLVWPFEGRDQTAGLKSQLATELSRVQFRANDLHAALRSAEAANGQPARLRQLIQMYDLAALMPPSPLQQLSAEYQQQIHRLDHLTDAHMGAASDAVEVARAELERTRARMDDAAKQEAADSLDTIRVAAATADDHVQQLRTSVEADRKAALDANAKSVQYDQLASAAERNEHALDVLDDRLKEIDFTKDVGPITISVLETAKPGEMPVGPVRTNVLGECLVVGALAGLTAALLADRLDQRLRSIEEIATLVDAAILGAIPRVVRRDMPGSVGRETFLLPRSATAEAFRAVRTAIYFGAGAIDERAVRTIMFTSPTPGDGKSTCVSNLAIAVAQAGRRVLLIDADCRHPVQHHTFKVPDGVGLTGVLTNTSSLADAVRPTKVERLDLLPCGPLPHNPAELLDSPVMLDLLAEAARQYDQVLVDSPPVNLLSDSRILAASCDAAVIVLRAERSTRRGATMAWNLLGSVGANRLGIVVNDVTRRTGGYHAYHRGNGFGPYRSKEPVFDGGIASHQTNGHPGSAAGRKPRAKEGRPKGDPGV